MAIYHCSVKPVSRGAGRSGTSAAAYRAGVCLKDERTGEVHDYTRKQGVEHSELVFPSGVNMSREDLWNAAEGAEKRKDARVAREFELALPAELNKEQRREVVTGFARHLVEQYGVAADVVLHEPNRKGDQRNHHAHILITTRQISAQGLGKKTDLEQEDKALRIQKKDTGRKQIETLRAAWEVQCNRALQRAGHHERVSHKSLLAQGIEREPTSHLGPVATAMERRGIQTERGELNRTVKSFNAHAASIEREKQKEPSVDRVQNTYTFHLTPRMNIFFDEAPKYIKYLEEENIKDSNETYKKYFDKLCDENEEWRNSKNILEYNSKYELEKEIIHIERIIFHIKGSIERNNYLIDSLKWYEKINPIKISYLNNEADKNDKEYFKMLNAKKNAQVKLNNINNSIEHAKKIKENMCKLYNDSTEYKELLDRQKNRKSEIQRLNKLLEPVRQRERELRRARERDNGWEF